MQEGHTRYQKMVYNNKCPQRVRHTELESLEASTIGNGILFFGLDWPLIVWKDQVYKRKCVTMETGYSISNRQF